jgi:chromosome partitioning protein
MVSMYGREVRLRTSLDGVSDRYDYVLIDCLPSLSLLTVNAMVAASEIFVPMQAHPFALEGLGKLFEVYEIIRSQMNAALKIGGVLVTMFDTRTNVSKLVVDHLQEHPRIINALFNTIVRQNIKIAESQAVGEPVIHYDPDCHGARAYRSLALEVIDQESSRGGTVPEAEVVEVIEPAEGRAAA